MGNQDQISSVIMSNVSSLESCQQLPIDDRGVGSTTWCGGDETINWKLGAANAERGEVAQLQKFQQI